MPITNAFKDQVVRAFHGEAIAAEAPYLRLSTTVPLADGTNWNEVLPAGYGGYAPQALAGVMGGPSNGAASSGAEVLFPTPTTGGAIVAAVGLWTAATGGTMRGWSALTPGQLIVAGAQVRIPIGGILTQAS